MADIGFAPRDLATGAVGVLTTADANGKARAARALAAWWRAGVREIGRADPPYRPARPARPLLLPPGRMPKRRRAGSAAGRIALLHALAHIELNAIDLALDLVVRFAGEVGDPAFAEDWVAVADDEGRHFLLLQERLGAYSACYGDLPAHDGLWQAAQDTADDLLARLAIVPMVLEARGLDVTPRMIGSLEDAGDRDSAEVLRVIHDDEVSHVGAGARWFARIASHRGLEPATTWRRLVRERFRGTLKGPFNAGSRDRAGMPSSLYEPLATAS